MDIQINLLDNKKVSANFLGHSLLTDQPSSTGGDGQAPSPFEFMLASIGTCIGAYVKFYCEQRGLSTEGISLIQHLEFDKETFLVKNCNIEIKLPPAFPEKYKEAIVLVAGIASVKRQFDKPPRFNVFTSINEPEVESIESTTTQADDFKAGGVFF